MEAGQIYENRTVSILLVAASLVLMINGIFNIEQFAVQYGIGLGAALQSNAYNVTVAQTLRPTVIQINTFYQTILESFFLTGIGFAMFVMAFLLLLRGPNRYESYMRRYVPVHLALTFVYVVLLLIIHATFNTEVYTVGLYATYLAIAVCIIFDVYLEYNTSRQNSARRFTRPISLNPSTPYSNLIRLKEELFEGLVGDVGIVDKHFNSVALSNLYRLIPESGKIRSFSIITSKDMLDSGFGRNYLDLKKELENRGIGLEIKIMKEEDAEAQHERFLLDDTYAYKIPPLNIINRKSEHILKMSMKDAKKRFDYLHQDSIKFENYT